MNALVNRRVTLAAYPPGLPGPEHFELDGLGKWGVGQRLVRNNILTSPAADANGALSYTMQVVNNQLLTKSFESTSGILDVYQFMVSFRYSFN